MQTQKDEQKILEVGKKSFRKKSIKVKKLGGEVEGERKELSKAALKAAQEKSKLWIKEEEKEIKKGGRGNEVRAS